VHLGADYGFPALNSPGQTDLVDVIARDMADRPLGLIVVSGDLTSRADANVLLSSGLNFLNALSDRLRVPREQFVIVPGNHDIALKNFTPFDYRRYDVGGL
jgi:3',5'-cyclic AMP phosphodiesterase CpdA